MTSFVAIYQGDMFFHPIQYVVSIFRCYMVLLSPEAVTRHLPDIMCGCVNVLFL